MVVAYEKDLSLLVKSLEEYTLKWDDTLIKSIFEIVLGMSNNLAPELKLFVDKVLTPENEKLTDTTEISTVLELALIIEDLYNSPNINRAGMRNYFSKFNLTFSKNGFYESWPILLKFVELHSGAQHANDIHAFLVDWLLECGVEFKWVKDILRAHWTADAKVTLAASLRQKVVNGIEDALPKYHLSSSEVPKRLILGRMTFAEDVYLECFKLIISTRFPNIEVIDEYNLDWQYVDEKLCGGEIDIAVNNDQLLSYDSSEQPRELYALKSHLYEFSEYTLLARKGYLLEQGYSIKDIEKARNEGIFGQVLYPAINDNKELFRKSLSNTNVSTNNGMVLEDVLSDLYRKFDLHDNNPLIQESDYGLVELIAEKNNLYLGGTIHANYAVNNFEHVVPLCTLIKAINGRVFSSIMFNQAYPKFCELLFKIQNHVIQIMSAPSILGCEADFQEYMLNHVNATLLTNDERTFSTVHDFEDLQKVLSRSKLQSTMSSTRRREQWRKVSSFDKEGDIHKTDETKTQPKANNIHKFKSVR